jgi:hypothetical protein
MNSPLVIEQAKRLVALPEFQACPDEESRIDFLYQRIYQRPPRPEEIKLGSEFVASAPESPTTSNNDAAVRPISNEISADRPMRFAQLGPQGRKGRGVMRKRAPLKSWEEYAHALLQANEASFVN